MNGIRISQKHGVNPSIPICFWCGKEKGEIMLLGRLPGDKEAPRSACYDYEPCKDCKTQMKKGVTIVETTESTDGRPPVSGEHYPTGRWSVISAEAWKRITGREGESRCLVDVGAYRQIIGPGPANETGITEGGGER